MKALTLSLAAVLVLSIGSTASALVVRVGPVRVAGRPAAVRTHRAAHVAPVYRPAARAVVHDRRDYARETVQDRRDYARDVIQDRRAAAWDAFLSAQP